MIVKQVINVMHNVMFDGWKRPVTVALMSDGSYATSELSYEADVSIGEEVVITPRRGRKHNVLVPCFDRFPS